MEEEFWKELKSKCSELGIDFDEFDKSDVHLMYNSTTFDVQCYEEDNKLYVPSSIVCMTIRGKEYGFEDYEFVDIDFTETYDSVSDAVEEVIDAVVNSNHRRKALKVINSFESFIEDMKQDELDILLSYIKNINLED